MIDWLIVLATFLIVCWMTWPPRGEQRRWLLAGLLSVWAALVVIGIRRGIQPGYLPWLILLAFMGALIALVVLWSLSNLFGRSKRSDAEK